MKMRLYSEEELEEFTEFEDLNEAFRQSSKVVRFRAYRCNDAAEVARIADLENLQTLSISLSNVSQLLPRLGKMKNLQELYLQACEIPDFPVSILTLHNLRSLTIGNSSLRMMPEGIGNLTTLKTLGLSQNCLQRVPDSIGQLIALQTLVVAYNQLEELPESVCSLPQLEVLSLGINRIRYLPDAIGRLNSLRSLYLDHNDLETLPDSICDLPNLNSLSIDHNPFTSLPTGLAKMAGLKELSVEADKRRLFMDWSYRHSLAPAKCELADLKLLVSPGSELYQPLLSTIEDANLSDVSSVILETAREAVKIETTVPDDYSQLGSSRFGGYPDLPDANLFPQTEGLYWCFLAQLNLADLIPFNSFLPRSGLLSFFIDSTENLKGKVLFYEGEFKNLVTIRHAGGDDTTDPDNDYTQRPHRLKFERYFTVPHHFLGKGKTIEDYLDYERWQPVRKSVDHHINGSTYTQHEAPEELAASKLGGQPHEWISLLQLGWDDKVGFCFWDAGTITFAIHRENLRRWDFSEVHVSLESS